MAQNIIDSGSSAVPISTKFFFYVKGSKDYPTDQVISDKFGYENNSADGSFAQTAIFDTSIKDILIRSTNPKQVDNLYSLYSDARNGIGAKDGREGTNIRNDRSKEYISSIIVDNGKVLASDVGSATRFVDHIDPNFSTYDNKPYTLANVKLFKSDVPNPVDNVFPLEHIFWQKIFTICEFIKKYESEIVDMYLDSSETLPSIIRSLSNDTLESYYGSAENIDGLKKDLKAETELGRYLALFIGKSTDASKHFETECESGSKVLFNGRIKYNPFRWKELTGQDTLIHVGDTGNDFEYTIDEEQEMFWNKEVLNMRYVNGTGKFELSSKQNRINKFTFEVRAYLTSTIQKTYQITCYLDPDGFVNSSSTSKFAVYTYNDEDMDGVVGADDPNYGIYDNDYANVTSKDPVVKNNFIASKSEFQNKVIQAITNIMKDGTYTHYITFDTMRVTPVIAKDADGNNTSNVVWDQINNSIKQTFYIFYGGVESASPTIAQQIEVVKDYIKQLHTSGKCHPMMKDDKGNIISIGHDNNDLDQFLANMYPELFTTTEVYIVPSNLQKSLTGLVYDPGNYFSTANIADMYNQLHSLGGIFSSFEYSQNGSASLTNVGGNQKNIPIEIIHLGGLNGVEATQQNSAEFKYPMPLMCMSLGTTDSRPLTSLSGFVDYKPKLFTYDSSNLGTFNYADRLQIVLIKLMEMMFTSSENKQHYKSIAGIPISYEIDKNADNDLQLDGLKKNVAKFVINNVNFTVIAHRGKNFANGNLSTSI